MFHIEWQDFELTKELTLQSGMAVTIRFAEAGQTLAEKMVNILSSHISNSADF